MAIVLIFSVAIIFFPREIFGLFTDKADTDVLALSETFIPIALIMFVSSSLRAVMNAVINGSGHAAINFVTALLDGIVLRIGLAVLFGLGFKMGYFGFWLGDALAGFTPFFVGAVFYLSGKWKKCTSVAGE